MEIYNTNESNIFNIIKDKAKQEINIDELKIDDYYCYIYQKIEMKLHGMIKFVSFSLFLSSYVLIKF